MKTTNKKRILICVCGGSGSGKTTVADLLIKEIEKENKKAFLLRQDNFYLPNWDKTMEQKRNMNYDHPDSFDWPLINKTVKEAMSGKECVIPSYDFTISERDKNKVEILETDVDVVIFEGLYTLYSKDILRLCDLALFIEVDNDIRFIRRLKRDTHSRGRSQESVINQWMQTVRPMHNSFIEPQKRKADLIIPWYKKTSTPIMAIKSILKEI